MGYQNALHEIDHDFKKLETHEEESEGLVGVLFDFSDIINDIEQKTLSPEEVLSVLKFMHKNLEKYYDALPDEDTDDDDDDEEDRELC